MDTRCYQHPDRPAVGVCCYCERTLCGECLCTNRQGRAYCRNAEDCLAYRDAQGPVGDRIPPILKVLCNGSSPEDQVQRLSACLEELEALEHLFECEGAPGLKDAPNAGTKDIPSVPPGNTRERIAGFCGARLLAEAETLLTLLSLRLRLLETIPDGLPLYPKNASRRSLPFSKHRQAPRSNASRNGSRGTGISSPSGWMRT